MDDIVIFLGFEIDNVFYYKETSILENKIILIDNEYYLETEKAKLQKINPSFLIKMKDEKPFVINHKTYLQFKRREIKFLKREKNRMLKLNDGKDNCNILAIFGLENFNCCQQSFNEFYKIKEFLIKKAEDCNIQKCNEKPFNKVKIIKRNIFDIYDKCKDDE